MNMSEGEIMRGCDHECIMRFTLLSLLRNIGLFCRICRGFSCGICAYTRVGAGTVIRVTHEQHQYEDSRTKAHYDGTVLGATGRGPLSACCLPAVCLLSYHSRVSLAYIVTIFFFDTLGWTTFDIGLFCGRNRGVPTRDSFGHTSTPSHMTWTPSDMTWTSSDMT